MSEPEGRSGHFGLLSSSSSLLIGRAVTFFFLGHGFGFSFSFGTHSEGVYKGFSFSCFV